MSEAVLSSVNKMYSSSRLQARWLNLLRFLLMVGIIATPFSTSINILVEVAAFGALLTPVFWSNARKSMRWWVTTTMLLFFILVLCRIYGSPADHYHKWKTLSRYVAHFLPIILLAPLLISSKWRSSVWNSLLASAVGLCGYFAIIGPWSSAVSLHLPIFYHHVTHINMHVQECSVLLAIGVFIALEKCIFNFKEKNTMFAMISLLLFSLCFYSLLDNQTERVGVVLSVFLFLYAFFTLFSRRTMFAAAVLMVCIIVGAYHFLPRFKTVIVDRTHNSAIAYASGQKETSAGVRLEMWKKSVNLWTKKPISGYGTGTFATGYSSLKVTDDLRGFKRTPENSYLQILLQMGLVGLAFFAAFLLSCWLLTCNMEGREKIIARGVMFAVALAAMSFPAFAVNNTLTWFSVVLAAAGGNVLAQQKTVNKKGSIAKTEAKKYS